MFRTVAVAAIALACAGPAAAQGWAPPLSSDGHPDIQGVWSTDSITTLERADRYKTLVIPPDQVEALTKSHPQVVRQATDDNQKLGDGLLNGKDLAQGRGYNAFWIDPGTRFGVVKGEARTSWIIDPPNGKIPYSPEGQKLASAARAKLGYSDPEARPLADRCLATGGRTGPPMINGLYNNHYQIVQTKGAVMIMSEMITWARIVRIGDRHEPDVMRPLFGDSVGHWEGGTLVVETTDFSPYRAEQAVPALLSEKAKVTERFTRVSPKELLYEFTVDDPVFYSQPWKGEITWRNEGDRVYEYACHEGNYAMDGILKGARAREARGLPPDQPGAPGGE
ncbi:MAG TPA: hypothetical protein VG942_12700 [Hyphomonadaceae bacterium]|nr:hypothetical protein [Hyphomonadaceae bacterium]